ncbi:RICIN domain-containing protein [Streptomyces sp. NPDC005500]|uniref:RICIN domain-containing protein n=1 Tax=Streptomyces sp. NPDC005500 TaxID=3155007 RepID=UPI0033AABC0B
MSTPYFRHTAVTAVVAASAAALVVGPLTSSAAAATFFRTVSNGNGLMLSSSSSSASNAPVIFGPEFKEDPKFKGATVGDPDTPAKLRWAQVTINGGLSVVHKATGQCLDVERSAEQLRADAVGAKVVLNPCDGTFSQRWFDLGAQQVNPHGYQNHWNKLILTNTGTTAVLEGSNSKLPAAERSKHVQTFLLNFVEVR